jgi:hypothetical protein
MNTLTIAYVTSRRDCRIEWFLDSLAPQIQGRAICIMAVDHFYNERSMPSLLQSPPKPNVWNGPHRLTSEDWFAMASARNTALCLCDTTYLAYVDDLSVLMPGWLDAVYEAVEGNYIGCGAYRKVKNLVVENGIPVSFEEGGTDNRISLVSQDVTDCNGAWLYGCSLVAPVEALLSVDGWPESICDGMGFEDCLMGIVLKNNGNTLKFDRRMMTLEAEELHFVEPAMKRSDYGVSPNDKSHKALEIARNSATFDNGFGEGGIRALREKVLSGKPFPIQHNPRHEWFTGMPLSEL